MEPSSNPRPRIHPLVATAAISVIVLSAVGVTALVMNRSSATPSPYDAPVATTAAPVEQVPQKVVAPPAPAPVPRVATAPQAAPIEAPTPSTPNYGTAPATPVYDGPPAPTQIARADICRDCGVVDSIQEIKVKGEGTGVGAVGGAVVGGLLGNMVGAGRGKALATVAGAVGGGFGGNAIEKNVRSNIEHQMVVRLDNGSHRTFTQSNPFPYNVGERVRIVDGHVQRG